MKITEKTFNTVTGEETIIERDETAAETKARLDREKEIAAAETVAADKLAARQAVYLKLGLTSDEVEALFN